MGIMQKVRDRLRILTGTRTPWALLCDSMHLRRNPYCAVSHGVRLLMEPGKGEWYTYLENIIRRDYLRDVRSPGPGDVVIDIGANIGAFTVLAASLVGPEGRVLAYEPDPEVFKRLQKNILINRFRNVECFNVAITGYDRQITLWRHDRSAYSTILEAVVHGRSSDEFQPVQIPALPVNEIVTRSDKVVSLLKIDCEGAEYEILEHLSESSARKILQISVEVHCIRGRSHEQLVDRLEALGYVVKGGYPLTAVR